MKFTHIMAAAGIAIASLGVATSADARPGDNGRHEWRHDNGRHWGHDRGRGWNRGWHNRCHTEWRHHHRVRICR